MFRGAAIAFRGAVRWARATILSVCLIVPSISAVAAETPAPQRFEIFRNGTSIGRHVMTYQREGDLLKVSINIDIKVTLAGLVTLFRYEHRNEETWRGDRLVALVSSSNNDGDAEFVRGREEGDNFLLESTSGARKLPGSIVSTTYWNPLITQRSVLLNSGDGTLMKVQVVRHGEEPVEAGGTTIRASRYEFIGDLNAQLWYDATGRWVASRFKGKDGSTIDYRLQRDAGN